MPKTFFLGHWATRNGWCEGFRYICSPWEKSLTHTYKEIGRYPSLCVHVKYSKKCILHLEMQRRSAALVLLSMICHTFLQKRILKSYGGSGGGKVSHRQKPRWPGVPTSHLTPHYFQAIWKQDCSHSFLLSFIHPTVNLLEFPLPQELWLALGTWWKTGPRDIGWRGGQASEHAVI